MDKTAAVILAAGEGKRMKSSLPKVLHEVLFKPMIDWVVDSACGAGIPALCVVVGHGGASVCTHLEKTGHSCAFAEQKEQLGTGHAVMQAEGFLKKTQPEDVLILCGDAPFITAEIIRDAYARHKDEGNAVTVLSAVADDPTGYGRIVRENGAVVGIVEHKDATPEQRAIKEVNAGAYWVGAAALHDALANLKPNNAQGEYYLTDIVSLIAQAGLRGGSYVIEMRHMAAANDRRQLLALNTLARSQVLGRLLDDGVGLVDESGVLIGPDVVIGCDTVILPGTIIKGKTTVGSGCTIGPNSLLEDCTVGDNVVINASQARQSSIANGVTVGPFSHLRPNTTLCENAHVGDFVEIKNSTIGPGSKAGHLTYVGDSDVGGGVNFGCGVITSNYDGVKKCRTVIGDNAFIGCNTNLIAPVTVGNGAYTAAGSTITKNVPDGALAVGRSRQENIEGWADKKFKAKKNK